MTSANLERLVQAGSLKREAPDQIEFDGLARSGEARLADAKLAALSKEGRFDLAYNAAHALSLAALRWHGFRSDNRYIVFQCLPHTLGVEDSVWRVLALCHERRNKAEYEGVVDIDDRLIDALVQATVELQDRIHDLGPVAF